MFNNNTYYEMKININKKLESINQEFIRNEELSMKLNKRTSKWNTSPSDKNEKNRIKKTRRNIQKVTTVLKKIDKYIQELLEIEDAQNILKNETTS